jgi:signal transduction histidine kinase
MLETLPQDPAVFNDEIALADVGELAGPLTHEVNNLLNNLTLHLAVMQQAGPPELSPDLDAIRRQISRFAGVVARFQKRRHRERGEPGPVDVNAAMTEAARHLQPAAVILELDRNLPYIAGHASDVSRLCRFLLGNAVRAFGGPPVVGRTQRTAGGIQLTVEDSGPDISDHDLPRIFEPASECRQGMCCLELAACRTLIRRLRGSVEARRRPQGGLVISVMLPVAEE